MEFGELRDVAVTEAWPHEAHDFTPWLADNLELLTREIGIHLEAVDTEVSVEQFSADILAVNPVDDSRVLIENQYGSTDHDHLGKVLTYLAGLEAQTIIWIAQEFHEAHLSAIRWLNEHTTDPFAFFAVRLRLVQIADSPMVPRFEVVERPNNWNRRVRDLSGTSGLSETGQFRREFWTYYAERHPGDIQRVRATSNQWVYVEEADLNISLALVRDKVGLFLRGNTGERGETYWERALPSEAAFRDQFPHWPVDEPIYDCAEWMYVDPRDRDNWPQMAGWLHEHLSIYRRILTQGVLESWPETDRIMARGYTPGNQG